MKTEDAIQIKELQKIKQRISFLEKQQEEILLLLMERGDLTDELMKHL